MDKIDSAIIDIETAIRWIEENDHHKFAGWMNVTNAMKTAKRLLEERKDRITHCKDCKHWIPGKITDNDDFIQPRCVRHGGGWSADEYCSDAEKEEEPDCPMTITHGCAECPIEEQCAAREDEDD